MMESIISYLADFIAMDGHGLYIWSAYAVTIIVLGLNFGLPFFTKAKFIRTEQAVLKRQAARSKE